MPRSVNPRTRIKICGLTRPEDAAVASACGVDAVGLVFYASSPRAVSLSQAAEICSALGPLVSPVALFVDPAPAEVEAVLARVPAGVLQFHGNEEAAFCSAFGRPWLKAVRMRPDIDLDNECARYQRAAGILLDSYRAGTPGGTGETFDWNRIPQALAPRLVLAGGLNADNVAVAIRQLRPAAVDVSGGVEEAPGRKHAGRIADFVAAVRAADAASASATSQPERPPSTNHRAASVESPQPSPEPSPEQPPEQSRGAQ